MINVPIEKLNQIYNACDLGINTSMGEGWGLTAHEMAAAGKPQLGPAHSATLELFDGISPAIKTIAPYTFDNIMTIGKIVSAKHLATLMTNSYKMSSGDYSKWALKTL